MNKRARHEISSWLIYSTIMGIILIFSIEFSLKIIGISIVLGFFAGILHSILVELRRMNGETFGHLDEE